MRADHARRSSPCCSRSSASAPARVGAAVRAGDGASGSRVHRASLGAAPRSSQHPDDRSGAVAHATASQFFVDHGRVAFIALGAVVLAVTGAEALYADMGHFGRAADPPRVVLARLPGADAQLPRPGRADPAPTRRRSTTRSSCWCPRWAPDPDGAARDGGHGDRLAGGDLRRVLGHAARRCSSASCRALTIRHTSRRARSARSTCPAINWCLFVAVRRARRRLRLLDQPRRRPTASRSPARSSIDTILFFVVVARCCWHKPRLAGRARRRRRS